MADEKKLVLFICTANSCRSQMAEGWARKLHKDDWLSFSAGIMTHPVNQYAIEVMAEIDIDISCQYSKHINDVAELDFDCVVTVCDNAKEQCPVFHKDIKVIHRSFDDPSRVIGSKEYVMSEFRRVRDEIGDFVRQMKV